MKKSLVVLFIVAIFIANIASAFFVVTKIKPLNTENTNIKANINKSFAIAYPFPIPRNEWAYATTDERDTIVKNYIEKEKINILLAYPNYIIRDFHAGSLTDQQIDLINKSTGDTSCLIRIFMYPNTPLQYEIRLFHFKDGDGWFFAPIATISKS